jgi:predicted permease
MKARALSSIAATIINRLAPEVWRESLIGDLTEERGRRRSAGRASGILWQVSSAIAATARLRAAQRKAVSPMSPTQKWFTTFGFECSQALRTLRRRPAFTAITILTLTLGIGANTAVFSLANWLMFRPVPGVARPDELVTIRREIEKGGGFFTMSVPDTVALARLDGIRSLTGFAETPLHVTLSGQSPARVNGQIVSSSYFSVLEQRAALGRVFTSEQDDPGRADVAVISHAFWTDTLGRDPNALGRTVTINGFPFTVIGIAGPGVRGTDRAGRTDIWVPIASFRHSMPSYPQDLLTGRVGVFFSVLARLSPGATATTVSAAAEALRQQMIAATPASASRLTRSRFVARPGVDVPAWQRDGLRRMFALLLAMAAMLLVLTCANTANLLIAHVHERRAELAMRSALGAGRARLIRLVLVESFFVAACGGILALVAAMLVGSAVNGVTVAQNIPALSAVSIDWRVFAFAFGVAVLTSTVAAIVPAALGSRADALGALKSAGRGHAPARRRIMRSLTAVQVAVAVALVAVSLLLIRSMTARYNLPLGFDADRVLAVSVDTGVQGYSKDRTRQYFRDALDAVRRTSGVSQAGLAWIEPFKMIGGGLSLRLPGQPESAEIDGDSNGVSGGFFPALGARFLSGRDFTDDELFRSDAAGGGVVLINETMARALFGTADATGREVEASFPEGRRLRVVGVIADIRTRKVGGEPVRPTAYEPIGQSFTPGWATLHARLDAPADVVAPRLREALRALDPNLPAFDVELLSQSVAVHLSEQRLLTVTIGAFAVLAMLVAALGLYGVLARSVEERRREFSIRAALGAAPSVVARLIAREALVTAVIGGLGGTAAALWLGRVLESRLFGVGPADPVSIGLAAGVALAAALAACAAPALRASRVDVVNELR